MYRILIVDDEEMIKQGLSHLINWSELNIEVAGFASNGREAMERISEHVPDILLCDIRMPVMDGLQLLASIAEAGLEIRTIILTGYEDFAYMKSAMKYKVENYLLKPVDREELLSTLLNVVEQLDKSQLDNQKAKDRNDMIRTNILNRLIANHIGSAELEDKVEYLGIKLAEPPFRVAILKLLDERPDTERFHAIAESTTGEILMQARAGISFQSISGNIILILSKPAQSISDWRALLGECLVSIKQLTDENVLITVGRPVGELCQVCASYEDARNLLDYRHIKARDWILFYEEEAKKDEIKTTLHMNLDTFEEHLLYCRKDKAFEFVDLIVSSQTWQSSVTPNQIRSYFMSVMASCFNVARHMKLDPEALLAGQQPIEKVMLNETGQDLSDWLKSFIVRIIDAINAKKRRNKSQIEVILEYIGKKYDKDLSLQMLASEFNISAPYLGTLFRNETGELFSVFLNKLRVEKAKELLLTTSYSANEISKLVGYWDANYFYKIFKKYTGVFPTQFRKI